MAENVYIPLRHELWSALPPSCTSIMSVSPIPPYRASPGLPPPKYLALVIGNNYASASEDKDGATSGDHLPRLLSMTRRT